MCLKPDLNGDCYPFREYGIPAPETSILLNIQGTTIHYHEATLTRGGVLGACGARVNP